MFTNVGKQSSSASRGQPKTPKSMATMQDVKARLSFSATRSPLFNRSSISRISPSVLTSPYNNHRLGDYHMSRQNPAVLDHMYIGEPSPRKDFIGYKRPLTPTLEPNRLPMSPNGSFPLTRAGRQHSLVMTSLVKQTLNNNGRSPLSNRSSLVQLAARGSPLHTNTSHVSPVIVKLSEPEKKNSKVRSPPSSHGDSMNIPFDPCDKNVVVSALKQKRKRWLSSVTVSPTGDKSPLYNNLPSSKKQRTTQDVYNLPSPVRVTSGHVTSPVTKKRGLTRDSLQSSKKSKPGKTKRLILPDVEFEPPLSNHVVSDNIFKDEDTRVEGGAQKKRNILEEDEEKSREKRERSATPPVDEEEEKDNEKTKRMKLNREATLKLKDNLTKVFPSPSREGSIARKKAPILCATGSTPYMALYSQSSATKEAVKKDREAATNRIKTLLTSDDPDEKKDFETLTTSTVSSTSTLPSISGSAISSMPRSTPSSLAVSTVPSLPVSNAPLLSVGNTLMGTTTVSTHQTTHGAGLKVDITGGLKLTGSLKITSNDNTTKSISQPNSISLSTSQPNLTVSESLQLPSVTSSLQRAPTNLSQHPTSNLSLQQSSMNPTLQLPTTNLSLQQSTVSPSLQQPTAFQPPTSLKQPKLNFSLTTPQKPLLPTGDSGGFTVPLGGLLGTSSAQISLAAPTNVTSSITNPITAFSGLSSGTTSLVSTSNHQFGLTSSSGIMGQSGSGIGFGILGKPENQTGGVGFASGTTQSGNSGGMNFSLQSGNGFGIAPQFGNQAGGTGINLSNQQTTLVPKPPVTSSNFQFSFPSNVQSQQSQQINLFNQSNQSNQSSNPPVSVPQNIFAFGNENVSTNTSSLAVPTSSSTVQLGPSSKGGFQFSLTNNTSFSSNVTPQTSFGKSLFNQQSSIQQQQKPSLQFGKQNSTEPPGNSIFNFGQKQQSQITGLQMPQQGQTQSSGLQFNFQKPSNNQNQSGNNLSTTSGGFNFGSGSSGQGQSLSFGGGSTGSVGNTPQHQSNLFDPTAKPAFNFSIGSNSSNKKQLDFGNTGNSGNTGAGMFSAGTGNNMSSFQNGQLNQSTPSMFQFGSQTSGTNQSNHVFNNTNPDSKPQFQFGGNQTTFGGNVSTNQNKFQFNIGGGGQPIQQPPSFTNNKPMFPFPSSSNTQMSVSQQNNTGFNFAAVPSNVGVNFSAGMNGKTNRPVASARRRRKI